MPAPLNEEMGRLGQPSPKANPLFTLNALQRANPLRLDPTRTILLRERFANEIRRRFRLLRRHVVQFIDRLDALGLKKDPPTSIFTLALPSRQQYRFQTDADKLRIFNEWLRQQIEEDILIVSLGEPWGWRAPLGSMAQGPWTTPYVESAYKRGILNAYIQARKASGVVTETEEAWLRRTMSNPQRLSKVQLLATRALEQLRGVTAAMAAEMNRILSQGLIEGKSPSEIASEMAASIEGLSLNRARRIAQTETIYAHAEGQLDSFEEMGIEEITVLAEWRTVGDDRVCPRCRPMQGRRFTIAQARGLIPLHPNCRCSWVAVTVSK